MNKIPCRRCGELESGRYHSSIFPRFKLLWTEMNEAIRMHEIEKSHYLRQQFDEIWKYIHNNYPDHFGRTANTIGECSEFEPISNLEYLEWEVYKHEQSE